MRSGDREGEKEDKELSDQTLGVLPISDLEDVACDAHMRREPATEQRPM